MLKILATGLTSLVALSLAAFWDPPPQRGDGPPPPAKEKGKAKAKEKGKKGEPGPDGDLRRAYDLLRRLRADEGPAGRPQERLRDWTERAVRLYREGLRARERGDFRLAHEYGASAHDLARAVDHARNAARFDHNDPDLPPPPDVGDADAGYRVRGDLQRAYERIRWFLDRDTAGIPDARFYLDAARDLYNAALHDLEDGRIDRAGELAKAAEAMTHVPEHLGHAADQGAFDRDQLEPLPPPERPRPGRRADLPPPLPF
jgi:hypothetical protein